MNADYPESLDEAAQIARAALPLAGQYALPVNPINYSVLYEYVAGKNSELNAALDQFREGSDALTDQHLRTLYENYVSLIDENAVQDVRQALSKIVDTTRGSLDRVGEKSQAYQDNLGAAVRQLADGEKSENVLDIVEKLVEETLRMQETSQSLQEELVKSNDALSTLRVEFKRVRHESLIDPLTGIQNRRAFDHSLAECCKKAKAGSTSACLLLVDIDHFKKVNDVHGHVVGDAVLKWVTNSINDTIRGGDVLARYGGEEFAVLLLGTSIAGAGTVAENICTNIRNQKLQHRNSAKVGCITVSVGVAQYHSQETEKQFVVRADTALYRAKENGRNRVCVHTKAESNNRSGVK